MAPGSLHWHLSPRALEKAEEGIPRSLFERFCCDFALLMPKIENFNVAPCASVLPKELFDNILPVDKVTKYFTYGAVLEEIMAGHGASIKDHAAIASGLGICWSKDRKGELIGGWAAEYREFFDAKIDEANAKASAEM